MSKEEQMTFFHGLSQKMEQKISSVDQRLERIEFIDERGKDVYSASFILEFDRDYSPEDIGHFRALLEVIHLNHPDPHPTLWFAGRDAYPLIQSGGQTRRLFGHKMIVWSRNPDHAIQSTIIGAGPTAKGFSVFSSLNGKGSYKTLADFDWRHVNLFVTDTLLEKLYGVWLVVNNRILLGLEISGLVPKVQNPLADWPEKVTQDEQKVPWVALLGKGDDPSLPPPAWPTRNLFIDFSRSVPPTLQ